MTDSKYFTTTKKGEIFEMKGELNSEKKEKKREAVKKVIASMTVGKDVSALFPDVVNCMQTDNLELKKLVYLYLMNYAKSQPDMAIMAVNTFVKDCEDPNPLIRALAVRTMGCIRVDKITEYLCEPLRKCLKDEDPYVRKTAAVCVAKLYDINAQLVEDQGFLDALRDLLSDSNPMVVANAVAALSEINEASGHPVIEMNSQTINKLLTALNECTEWGQVFILDFLANYNPKDDREAQSICERVTPRLAHANAAVVLSAVKVCMKLMEMMVSDSDYCSTLTKKLAPPLVTLLSSEPEVQYVALRNINLIVQKRPDILKHEMKVFFVKYNDPIYVKLEKLDIMIRLATQANIAQVLAELKEYATEVDVDFVRKSVRAIGRCAIKVEQSAERCVSTLLDLIQTKVNYVVQEAVVVIKDIFRKYPNKYESIISTLCENLDTLDEPEARASMIWIIGEYAERIDNADELLESFLDAFHDENTQVQLALLTAIVKLFLKRPTETQELVQQVLSLATQLCTCRSGGGAEDEKLDSPPLPQPTSVIPSQDSLIGDLLSLDMGPTQPTQPAPSSQGQAVQSTASMDLLGGGFDYLLGPSESPVPQQQQAFGGDAGLLGDIFGVGPGSGASAGFYVPPKQMWLPAAKGKGLEITGTFSRRGGQIVMDVTISNKAMQPMEGFAIQLNKNSFGLVPAAPLNIPHAINPNQSTDASMVLNTNGPVQKMDPLTNIQVAIKNIVDVFYFACIIPIHVFFTEDGQMDKRVFLATWKDIPAQNEVQYTLSNMMLGADTTVLDAVSNKLQQNNIFTIAKRNVEGQDMLYQSLKLTNGIWVLTELKIAPGNPNYTIYMTLRFHMQMLSLKSRASEVAPTVYQAFETILRQQ
ncbi:PREDICTED: AP-1 complex subunit beta-1-like [Priapulus caudatus]|uniref:AP-1 complex subunit beta-1-like n=1 Tax=Priapulus caudatus TaxID=37621 RepID=A0ABM1DYC7_PRICU|nr:PREDICTED: AP-1 complex subunit beta-1-like [Priapulus caudatus]